MSYIVTARHKEHKDWYRQLRQFRDINLPRQFLLKGQAEYHAGKWAERLGPEWEVKVIYYD